MVELFYPDAVLARMALSGSPEKESATIRAMPNTQVAQYWAGHNIDENDWLGLASSLLSEIFSAEFLTPLQEVDTAFALKVSDLTTYSRCCKAMHASKTPESSCSLYMFVNILGKTLESKPLFKYGVGRQVE